MAHVLNTADGGIFETCQDRFDEPVETIDCLSLSPGLYAANAVAASPNPQPRDDILYKDLV